MLNETLRGIFTINIIFKAYERVMKIQTEMLQETMSNMQAARKKNRSTTDDIIIIKAIMEKRSF